MSPVRSGFTVLSLRHSLRNPSRVIVSVSVKLPAAVATTVTDAPVVPPWIVPLPLHRQPTVPVPPAGPTVEVYVLVVNAHTGAFGLMSQVRCGLTLIVC